ncbi:MAG: OsmC family protein [Burkholderiales bacterium]
MSSHSARIDWKRTTPDFAYSTYDRSYMVNFDDGITVPGTAARANIPPTAPQAPGVDPEQAFVASLSSCHMLWFLYLACEKKFIVDRYTDEAVGVLEKNRDGRMAMTRVTLRPLITFGGDRPPGREQLQELHEKAHARCFIANSVLTEVVIEPQ